MKAPFKCNKCGAPIELDPYKDFVKCCYCGSINIFENGRLISKSDRYLNKVGEYLSKLKQKKVFIPLIIFSILVPVSIYKVNYIDDFLVKECEIRAGRTSITVFSPKNFKKCLRNIKTEWKNKLKAQKEEILNACQINKLEGYRNFRIKYRQKFDLENPNYEQYLSDNNMTADPIDDLVLIEMDEFSIERRKYKYPELLIKLPWEKSSLMGDFLGFNNFSEEECKKILDSNLEPYVIFNRYKGSYE